MTSTSQNLSSLLMSDHYQITYCSIIFHEVLGCSMSQLIKAEGQWLVKLIKPQQDETGWEGVARIVLKAELKIFRYLGTTN